MLTISTTVTNAVILGCKTSKEGATMNISCIHSVDYMMRVGIDRDKLISAPGEQVAETRNKIDMELMHGTALLCKKILLASEQDRKSQPTSSSFIRRA